MSSLNPNFSFLSFNTGNLDGAGDIVKSRLRRLELNATINSEVVIASENVVEMCATKNKSCAMLHHTHDVIQGISWMWPRVVR